MSPVSSFHPKPSVEPMAVTDGVCCCLSLPHPSLGTPLTGTAPTHCLQILPSETPQRSHLPLANIFWGNKDCVLSPRPGASESRDHVPS